jgi:hypothetical protein
MAATQNQHYLPQSYQRGWADAADKVHVYQWHHSKLVCAAKATKSTGREPGLYFSPMAPSGQRNVMEDSFWRLVDQWGADGLALLRSTAPGAAAKLDKERIAVFIMSLLWRNPIELARIDAEAKRHVASGVLTKDYDAHRRPHEPATLEEFVAMLNQPGLTEYGAQILRSFVLNQPIRAQLLSMNWQVVTVPDDQPILTSDAPVIRHRGLKDEDGMLILPLSANEFFVAFNNGGQIDMMRSIEVNIQDGIFVAAMNKSVVRQKVKYVYGIDDKMMDFVARHWAVSTALTSNQPAAD